MATHIVKERAQKIDHEERDAQPQHHAEERGYQIVEYTFGEEHLHQMATLHADGAGHAHFTAPFGGQHHEDHKDEQHTRHNREDTEDREDCAERRAGDTRHGDDRLLVQRVEDVHRGHRFNGSVEIGAVFVVVGQVEQPGTVGHVPHSGA